MRCSKMKLVCKSVSMLAAVLVVCRCEAWKGPPLHHTDLYSTSDPVILVGLQDNTYFQHVCTHENLLEQYNDTTVTLSSANTHSYAKYTIPFTDYLNHLLQPRKLDDVAGDTWYFFGNNDYERSWTNFTKHYLPPEYSYMRDPFFSFGIGGSGSGVPFHTHGAVFAEVVHGAKRWFLSPPDKQPVFSPDETSYRWYRFVYSNDSYQDSKEFSSLLECTLYPNEVLWIDAQWWHATLNIGDTVFISTFV
eukprot:gene8673-1066_t